MLGVLALRPGEVSHQAPDLGHQSPPQLTTSGAPLGSLYNVPLALTPTPTRLEQTSPLKAQRKDADTRDSTP